MPYEYCNPPLLTEYNEAEAMELFREDGRKEGREEGRAEGREATLIRNLQSLMQSLGCTAEEAMDHLSVPDEERPKLLAKLSLSVLVR